MRSAEPGRTCRHAGRGDFRGVDVQARKSTPSLVTGACCGTAEQQQGHQQDPSGMHANGRHTHELHATFRGTPGTLPVVALHLIPSTNGAPLLGESTGGPISPGPAIQWNSLQWVGEAEPGHETAHSAAGIGGMRTRWVGRREAGPIPWDKCDPLVWGRPSAPTSRLGSMWRSRRLVSQPMPSACSSVAPHALYC